MSKFDKLIGEKIWELNETTITPTKPKTPTIAPPPREAPKEPNPFTRPRQKPFVQPRPKASTEGDLVANYIAKKIDAKLNKYKNIK